MEPTTRGFGGIIARGWGIIALALTLAPGVRAGDLGVDVNADRDAFGKSQIDSNSLLAFSQHNTVYPLPLFNAPAGNHARYWDSMVEQY